MGAATKATQDRGAGVFRDVSKSQDCVTGRGRTFPAVTPSPGAPPPQKEEVLAGPKPWNLSPYEVDGQMEINDWTPIATATADGYVGRYEIRKDEQMVLLLCREVFTLSPDTFWEFL